MKRPPRFRIVRHDKLNWRIEEWTEGGTFRGVQGPPRWKGLESYHSSLRHAALSLLDHAAGDALLTEEVQSVQEALCVAERRVQDALDRLQVGGPV